MVPGKYSRVLAASTAFSSRPSPCPCGFYGDTMNECRCTPAIIQRYLGKISGPVLDPIDLHIEVPAVPYRELRGNEEGVTSDQMHERVLRARARARARQQALGYYNAHLPP